MILFFCQFKHFISWNTIRSQIIKISKGRLYLLPTNTVHYIFPIESFAKIFQIKVLTPVKYF